MKNEYFERDGVIHIKVHRKNKTHFAKIDAEDLPRIDHVHSWNVISGAYDINYIRTGYGELLHRIIMDTPPKMRCIFKNGDTFDCRKSNLQNVKSVRPRTSRDDSMRYIKRIDGYIVKAWHDGKLHYLGFFKTLKEATKVRNDFLIKNGRGSEVEGTK